ncbi:pseudaminic acid cytidylyltransferase [Pseudomonas stutzeri]|uniref:pseudaminic acid cytidylyltransferase n=1 Tax=Stutzerimonas stutzeri TaxID=316 RepID=UPI00190A1EFE|nr:pseudaminic acid cytidylyltransferase [Stutzerimonas stutzeri]MBK3866153.1 pseudaminic acid cytidylyltransferase [Stutzerimonas stutzeri]
MKVAVIPARGGSKRIPRKNIKSFCGKPMIAWSIEAAMQSGCFDQIIVSTEDHEIADVARAYGALTPFLRPQELADDYSPTAAVITHAVEWLNHNGMSPHSVCCIYATAPFIAPRDISASLALLEENQCDYVLPVTSFDFPIQRALRLEDSQLLRMVSPQFFSTRSQELEDAYHDAGQFCWGTTAAWVEGKPIFEARSHSLILPRYRVQDIDTEEDWIRAELLFKALMKAD